jgi:hypothetical protein
MWPAVPRPVSRGTRERLLSLWTVSAAIGTREHGQRNTVAEMCAATLQDVTLKGCSLGVVLRCCLPPRLHTRQLTSCKFNPRVCGRGGKRLSKKGRSFFKAAGHTGSRCLGEQRRKCRGE